MVRGYEAGSSVSQTAYVTSHQEREMNRKKKSVPTKPFFARFLEKQALDKVAGAGNVTLKFPSDNDEDVTLKFPSDNDEDVTQKFPSDSDESGGP
jgi:Serine endopeptidase inhibitors